MKNFSSPLPTNLSTSVDTFASDVNKLVDALTEIRSSIPAVAGDVAAVSISDYNSLLGRITAIESSVARLENPTTGVVAPSAPTITSVSAGDTIATVYFNAPAVDGGASVTKYVVKASTGKTVEGTASPITVTGLTNGASVTFTVSAVNSVGTGTPSAVSAVVTPSNVTKPGAPTNVSVTNADAAVTIGWSTPASDGGSTITGYRVTLDSSRTVDVAANVRSQTFANLVNGQSYNLTVAAINTNGVGTVATIAGKPASTTIPSSAVVAPSSAFTTSGTWQSGNNGEIYSQVAGSTATLTFTGTYLELSSITDSHHTSFSVKIDNGAAVTLSQQTGTRNADAVVYIVGNLASGTHTVTITVLAATGTPTITVLKARVAAYASSEPGPIVVQPISGFVQRSTSSTGLVLNGKPYKFVGYNAVNMIGPTNSTRQIVDDLSYFKNVAPGMTDRVWYQPGSTGRAQRLDDIVQYAKANGSRLIITLFDALGSGGPKWDVLKSNFSTYRSHIETVVGKYKNDPTIAAWEIANEPPNDRAGFDLIGQAIKAIDPNHLVCTGTLAVYSDSGVPAFQEAGASPYVDILSMHEYDSLQQVSSHLARILPAADALKKPIYIGEFGIDASPSGNGTGGTAPGNGHTSWSGRATLIGQKANGYLSKSQVCGIGYWSIGQNHLGDTILDSYMPLSDTAGINAMKAASAQWTKNAN